jgi:hypothetical protein
MSKRSSVAALLFAALVLPLAAQPPAAKAGKYFEEVFARFMREAHGGPQSAAAQQIEQLIKSGQLARAVRELDALAERQDMARLVREALRDVSPEEAARAAQRATRPLVVLSVEDLARFKPLERYAPSEWLSIRFVNTRVKQFLREIGFGSETAVVHLSFPPPEYAAMATRWRAKPKAMRIGLITAGIDDELAQQYRREKEAQGFVVFFYKICLEAGHLCPDKMVGAFLADAGQVVVLDTPAAAASAFVFPEALTVRRLRTGEGLLIIVSPEDLIAAAKTSVVIPVTTFIFTE